MRESGGDHVIRAADAAHVERHPAGQHHDLHPKHRLVPRDQLVHVGVAFTNACRAGGGEVIISGVDIWSSNNPSVKLAGVLYIFTATPGTIIADDATFAIASSDFGNLTGQFNGVAFTLGSQQASGAANSGMSLAANMPARCAPGSTTLYGMVEVTNAYVPASAEV